MMMTIEMILNETKKETMETMGDASECVPATLMRQSDRHCARHTRYHALIASPRASPARSWQQMMRARLGIDKNKSWADWAEEEEEAAEPTKTLEGVRLRGGAVETALPTTVSADAKPAAAEPAALLLSMRLRGGAAECESGQESGEESGDEGDEESGELGLDLPNLG